MSSAEELIARIDAAKKSIEENQAALSSAAEGINSSISELSAVKSEAEDLSSQLAGLSIEDRAVLAQEVAAKLGEAEAAASSWKTGSENQTAQGDGIQTTLDEAIAQAQGLGGLSHGASGGSPPTQTPQQSELPAGSEPTGEKLLEMSENARGVQGFLRSMTKSDEAADATESIGESVSNLTQFSHPDLDPPPTHTSTGTEVPSYGHPVIQSDRPAVDGSAPVAALVLTLVGIKGGQKVKQAWHQVSNWRKRESR